MIEVVVENEEWLAALPDAEALAGACLNAAQGYETGLVGKEMSLLLASDEAVAALNRRFRQKDRPTNVLSFPSGDDGDFLGDMALARQTCVREATERQIALQDHAAHLIIHAMLHLVGYDHQTDEEAEAMERRETEILVSMGVADPYADALELL